MSRFLFVFAIFAGMYFQPHSAAAPLAEWMLDSEGFLKKSHYRQALKNGESGNAQDAYFAYLAYSNGWNKKKNWGIDRGLNRDKAWSYLNTAASLGHPQANFLLYACYLEMSLKCVFSPYRQWKNDNGEFGPDNAYRAIPVDPKKARYFLEEAERLGADGYRATSSQTQPVQPAYWAHKHRRDAMSSLAHIEMRKHDKYDIPPPTLDHRMYPDALEFCDADSAFNLSQAQQFPKEDCATSRFGKLSKYCTEILLMKNHLKNCMGAATTVEEYEHYLQAYFEHFNLRQDVTMNNNGFLLGVKRRYLQFDEKDKAELAQIWFDDAARSAAGDEAVYRAQTSSDRAQSIERNRARDAKKAAYNERASQWEAGRSAREAEARRNKQSFGQVLAGALVNSSIHQEAIRQEELQRRHAEAAANVRAQQNREHQSAKQQSANSSRSNENAESSSSSSAAVYVAPSLVSAQDQREDEGEEATSGQKTQKTIGDWRSSDDDGPTNHSVTSGPPDPAKEPAKEKKVIRQRYDVGLSDNTYGEALEYATAKADRVCGGRGGPVNIHHESVKEMGFKFKAVVYYECQEDYEEVEEYGGYGYDTD